MDLEDLIEKISKNPKSILQINQSKIEKGSIANLTIFSTSEKWEYTEANNLSKSINSFFLNTTLTGKVKGIINNKQVLILN